jgi:hypothetical protein
VPDFIEALPPDRKERRRNPELAPPCANLSGLGRRGLCASLDARRKSTSRRTRVEAAVSRRTRVEAAVSRRTRVEAAVSRWTRVEATPRRAARQHRDARRGNIASRRRVTGRAAGTIESRNVVDGTIHMIVNDAVLTNPDGAGGTYDIPLGRTEFLVTDDTERYKKLAADYKAAHPKPPRPVAGAKRKGRDQGGREELRFVEREEEKEAGPLG